MYHTEKVILNLMSRIWDLPAYLATCRARTPIGSGPKPFFLPACTSSMYLKVTSLRDVKTPSTRGGAFSGSVISMQTAEYLVFHEIFQTNMQIFLRLREAIRNCKHQYQFVKTNGNSHDACFESDIETHLWHMRYVTTAPVLIMPPVWTSKAQFQKNGFTT